MSKPNSTIDSKNMLTSGRSAPQSLWLRLSAWMLSRQVAWIVLLLSLLLTFGVWKNAQQALLQAQQVQFENRAEDVTTAIVKRMQNYELVLRGGVGLFAASKSVERDGWRDYVASLNIQEQYPGIQGVNISVHIPAARLNAHLSTIRAEGFPDYAIRPAGVRAEYTPLIYLEPYDARTHRAFGFDMYAEAKRRATMERARDTGGTAMSAKVTLVTEGSKEVQPGMVMYLPLYKNGAPHNTLAERRANLFGYVSSPFRLNDLMRGILEKKRAGAEPDIDIEVYDGTQQSVDSLLYDDDGIPHALGKPPAGSLTLASDINMYGHTWSLYFTSRPVFHAAFDNNKPLLILLFGVLLSVMFSGLIWTFATQRRRALVLVNHRTIELTKEITERKKALKDLQDFKTAEDSHSIISIADLQGNMIEVNAKFSEISGYSKQELLGKNHRLLNSGYHPKAFFEEMWSDIASGKGWHGQIKNRRKDGSFYWVESTITPILDENGVPEKYISVRTDITQIKASEAVLRVSEQRLNHAQQVSRIGSYEWDIISGEVGWSEEQYRLWGFEPYSVTPSFDLFLQGINPDDQILVNKAVQNAMANKELLDVSYRFTRPDGSEYIMHTRGEVTYDNNGNAIKLVGSAQDITEHKRQEQEVELHKERLRRAQAFANIGTWDWDIQSGELHWSERIGPLFGYPEGMLETTYENFLAAVHPEDRQKVIDAINACVEHGSIYEVEHRCVWPDGTVHWLLERGDVVRADDGTPLHMLGVVQDVTERKQAQNEILLLNASLEDRVKRRTEKLQRQQNELRESEEKFRAYFDRSMVGMAVTSLEKGWINVNDALCASLGYSREELMRMNWSELTYPEDLALDNEQFNRVLKGEIDSYELDKRFVHKDGHLVYTRLAVSCVRKNDATVDYIVALVDDISERKQAEEELHLAAMVFLNSSEAMTVTDSKGNIVSINPAFTQITGYTLEEVVGRNARFLSSGRHDNEFYRTMWEELNNTGRWQGEIWNRRKNGELYLEWITINAIYHDDGLLYRYVSLFSDITQKKESDELIWKQANFDTLTGLPNRRMFHDRLEQEIKKSHRSGLPMALMLLDLDRFKEVNDTLGHAQGDVLLVEAARRIAECVRESDTVARLGGDEFTVILSEMEDVHIVERIAQNIIERLAAPFQLLQEAVFVSASVGITLYPDDSQNIDALVSNADQAMYVAKNLGRNRFSYFTKALQEAAQTRIRLISDLRGALPGKQLMVYYQPIVELATGKIHKAEALLRWQHPKRGMVSPAQFIPLAEESGLIHEIGDWVFHEATREVKSWRERFVPEFQISVNKSPVQFRKNMGDDASSWLSHLRAMDLPGQSLVIEITEGLLLNAEINVTEKLLSFRDAGVQVSLDDFGTGYSSLSYLKKFDIDFLKIDQSFVRNLADDTDDQALCEAIIVMAHKLGLKVIAEGVETEQQRDLLAAYGCDYAQGWLYSKAVPAEQFEALLQRQGRT